ncbi:protocadherin gamma-C5-like isoform X1 [Hemitrygon akajei]|uniref:protocadherin gamma-C5-like isoform X1 n=1 Tax=Hemitrygon akajei TaxID=2704970 RepID=UPI003BF9CB84
MASSAIKSDIVFKNYAILILVCTPNLIFGHIRFAISEELESGAFVGNIAQDLGLSVPQLAGSKFALTSENGGQYMELNLENGILSVRERIDREHICGYANVCNIPFKIVLKNPLAVYRGEVEILDINDNSPTFPESTVALQIAEAIAPGVRFPLESAEDPDIGLNTVADYTINSSEYFSLRTQKTEGEFITAELVLEKSLDRELQSSIRIVLTATDAGTPRRSGTAEIFITVVDINDNPPVFDHNVYKCSLSENVPLGTFVIKIQANDVDEGLNAELTYSFSKITSPKLRELFSLDSDTGEIRVEGELDFEEESSYYLNVQAVDHGSPPFIGRAKVFINLVDINDNAPEIEVSSAVSRIPENSPSGTLITFFNVFDRDSGENGEVKCEIPKNVPFRLQTSSKNHYELITCEPLDREVVSEYKIPVVAWDLGSPSLSSNAIIHVIVSDVNDNTPQFAEPSYNVYVMENNEPGASVFAVSASDPDLDQNSYVSYSFVNFMQDFPLSSSLSINSMNGTIYALRSFDYEKFKHFQIHVQARDGGVPPLSSTATVNVIILDQNGNAPAIAAPPGQKESDLVEILPLSTGQGHLVAKILATDADSGQNARLSYQVQRSTDPSLFNVDKNSGEVRTARIILESDSTTQTLVILVKDNGQPSLSTTVSMLITILENITEKIPESSNLAKNTGHFPNPITLLIVIFGCTSVLFLLIIILLIGIKCMQSRNINQEYNSPNYYKRRQFQTTFNRRSTLEETLRYPGTCRIGHDSAGQHYSVSLSPESMKSDFLFLKPCAAPKTQAKC